MVYDRNRGDFGRPSDGDYGRDYGSGRDYTYSSARDYQAAGEMGGRRGRFDDRSSGYYGGGEPNRGSYAGDGRRFTETDRDDDDRSYGRDQGRGGFLGGMAGGFGRDRDDRNYNRSTGGRDDDRGFFERAGDEVRSWFGGDDDDRGRGGYRKGRRISGDWQGDRVHDHRDRHYHEWRSSQISQLDRDYDEYRREHQSKFENEFSSWRTGRQTQRQMLNQVEEHAEVFGSDGERVGTVDKVRGDRIILTKNDPAAGGHHHSIPSSWLQSVEGNRVTISKSSTEAKTMWRDEEYQEGGGRSMFGGDQGREHNRSDGGQDMKAGGTEARDNQGRILNRSFSGTYEEK